MSARKAAPWGEARGMEVSAAVTESIDREVRRVRALAEGRLIRETERVVLWPDGIKRPLLGGAVVPKGWPVLRVTRIRRPS